MKRALIIILLSITGVAYPQCQYNCNTYQVSSIPFMLYPAGGNTLSLADDDLSTAIPIGFIFQYYCGYYNQARICSNGFLTFDLFSTIPTANTPYPQQLPDPKICNDVIAYNWNDLDPSVGGTITYTTLGTTPNCTFVLTYSNVPLWNVGGSNTGQIVLLETSNLIQIHTLSATNNGWLPNTQGIENLNGTAGATVPGRNYNLWAVSPSNPSSYVFSPYTMPQPTVVTGQNTVCEGGVTTLTVVGDPNASGFFWNFPGGGNAYTTSSVVTATILATGNVSVGATFTCGTSAPFLYSVTALPSPTVYYDFVSDTLVCSGKPVTFSVSGSQNFTLQPGNITGTSPLQDIPGSQTTYSLYGISNAGCITLHPPTVKVYVKPSPTISVNSGSICNGNSFTITYSGADAFSLQPPFSIVSPSTGIYQYTVTGTDNNNCSVDVVRQLTVAPLPIISISVSRTYACKGETVSLKPTGGVSYTWSTGQTTPTIGITLSTFTIYSVHALDANGCAGNGSVTIKVSTCDGIEDASKMEQPQVFPNPSAGDIKIQWPGVVSGKILSLDGREVDQFEFTDMTIVHPQLAPGVYLLNLQAGGKIFTTRLLIR